MNTSEIRGEVEQTRWQLLQDSGIQKTELLRARQDMVNRIIQMGEKVQCCIIWFRESKHVREKVVGTVLLCYILSENWCFECHPYACVHKLYKIIAY